MASMPEKAVTLLGQPAASAGSMMARFAIMESERIERLKLWIFEPSTAFLVTSEPVPLVVGTAMKGTGSTVTFLPLPTTSM